MSECEHCEGKGKIEMDNNGPIVDCPVCKTNGVGRVLMPVLVTNTPLLKEFIRHKEAVKKHGEQRASKAERLAIVTVHSFYHWVEMSDQQLDKAIIAYEA